MLTLARDYVRYAPWRAGKALLVDRYLNAALKADPVVRLARLWTGQRVRVDTRDIVQRYLYQFGVWEPNLTALLRRRLRPGDVFVDCGANIGYFSLVAAHLVGPAGRVVAVEASPSVCAVLRGNLALNRVGTVRTVPKAVSDRAQTLAFYQPVPGAPSVTTSVRPSEADVPVFEVDALPLAELVRPEELRRARLIKIDVEGGEHVALAGLRPVLGELRPEAEIVVEVSQRLLASQSHTVAETVELLTSQGFHPYRLANSYRPSSYVDTAPGPALRVRGELTGDADLVFSRLDAEAV
ncbi:FkbM family methyltransferase [Crossiella sp. SN42]|uniref:FkbM family methyltransferase n=1 Tax=Crossiella sp. SN42 TaxID=2944808 RepID=UPI00207CB2EE|nr:FkbM family methyltransferase [Crossiella sp. SN42]MCO1580333.1 FkbM family methyltransferase [Crossiella sp. SN42]